MPVRLTACGDPLALSLMESKAARVPAAVGLNVRLIEQAALTASDAGQVLVLEKSAAFVPAIAMDAIFTIWLPVFVRVTVCTALPVPTF